MIAFEVRDMSCGHCAGTITKAVATVDRDATVRIDLATHRVEIDPVAADAAQLRGAIETAGYTPVAIEPGALRPR
jgi:copper chaperone